MNNDECDTMIQQKITCPNCDEKIVITPNTSKCPNCGLPI